MTLDRLGRWRLPVIAVLAVLLALAVAVGILLVGNVPGVFNGSPTPSASSPTRPSESPGDTPEAAVRAFFEAFADARETDDPAVIEPFVNGTDSSAYQTAASFLEGQKAVGKASITTVQELTDFSVTLNGGSAVVEFTYRAGGYDIDLDTGEPQESPEILDPSRVRAEVVRVGGRWLLDSYEEVVQ
jgi:hypothetical protein